MSGGVRRGLVSVVIPTFRRAALLGEALRSVAEQTYRDVEVLVVDDAAGGDAETRHVVQREWGVRVQYLQNLRRRGANGARNSGICSARGALIALLDDDDTWFARKLEEQVSLLGGLSGGWGGVYCGYEVVRAGTVVPVQGGQTGYLGAGVLLGSVVLCGGSTLLLRRSVVEDVGLLNEDLLRYQDLEFVVRVCRSYKLGAAREILARINGHNPPKGCVIEAAKQQFLAAVEGDIVAMGRRAAKRVYAVHQAEVALGYARDGEQVRALSALRKAMAYRIWNPVRYATVLAHVADGVFGTRIAGRLEALKARTKAVMR